MRFSAIPIEALNPACEDEETVLIRIRVGGAADVFILGVVEGLVTGVFFAYRLGDYILDKPNSDSYTHIKELEPC